MKPPPADSPLAAVQAHVIGAQCNYVTVAGGFVEGLYYVHLDVFDTFTRRHGQVRVSGYDPARTCLRAIAAFDGWLGLVRSEA